MVLLRGFDQLPGAAALSRRSSRCGRRRSPPTRCTAASPSWSAWTCSRPAAPSPTSSPRCASTGQAYDFFFVHYKDTDKAGEDGDFDAKVAGARALRRAASRRSATSGPTSSSSPATTRRPRCWPRHGWQPVPVLVWSRYCGADPVTHVHRARVRGGHSRRAAGAPPDAARHGQCAAAHQVRGLRLSHAVPHPPPRCAVAGHAPRQLRLRVVRGPPGAHAPDRGPPAPGGPGRRRRPRGHRAAGGARRARRLRARPHALRPAGPRPSRSTTPSAA